MVVNCALRADWQAAVFEAVSSGGTIGPPVNLGVDLRIRMLDKRGQRCVSIQGLIDVPFGSSSPIQTVIPLTTPWGARFQC